jgi:hypothetical protein
VVSYDSSSKPKVETVFFITELKATDTITSSTWVQVATFMAIVRRKRMDNGKTNATIFGCLTDSIEFYFLRLDTAGKLHKSKTLEFDTDYDLIYTYFVRSIQRAKEQSPNTTLLLNSTNYMEEIQMYEKNESAVYEPLYTYEPGGEDVDEGEFEEK